MHITNNEVSEKINSILFLMCITFIVIIARLLYFQVYCADYFLLRSEKNFIRHETSDSPRGLRPQSKSPR